MEKYQEVAKKFCDAVRKLASDSYALDNLEDYLSIHFPVWLERFAGTPEDITVELEHFASISE